MVLVVHQIIVNVMLDIMVMNVKMHILVTHQMNWSGTDTDKCKCIEGYGGLSRPICDGLQSNDVGVYDENV